MGGVQFSEISVNSKAKGFLMTFCTHFGRLLECFGGLFSKMEHQKASGRANLTKLDVKKTGLKKHQKMKGYCGSRWRRWWGQAEGGESKDSSSGVL